ncbi:Protein FAM47E [Microtus ochrogaster]|uniref:Protein FAM47E n=1 Tax=Microtus ochrogaster TaxID=79684 RepID=A0A8J6GC59_MICOH|nr:Protein FAM47E [Microtus ochrogaster]
MAERGQRLQLPSLPRRLLQEHRNCGPWHLETLPSKSFMKPKRPRFPGPVNSRRWVFVREDLDDFRKGCPRHQHPKDVSLPHVHHRLPQATPKKRQNGLPEGAARLSKLPQTRKAFLEGVEDSMVLHPLARYPHLEEALPPELLLQVLEVLDPEKNLEETWAYCRDSRKLLKGPTELEEKCSSPGSSPLEEEFILQQFDLDYHTRRCCAVLPATRAEKRSVLSQLQEAELCHKPDHERRLRRAQVVTPVNLLQDKPFIDGRRSLREHGGCWNKPRSSGRASPHRPKRVKMRYGAWYLKTNLWKKQRADEPLVDPKISHKAQDANFEKHLREQAELLAGLHGTVAFKDFILSRGYRMPRGRKLRVTFPKAIHGCTHALASHLWKSTGGTKRKMGLLRTSGGGTQPYIGLQILAFGDELCHSGENLHLSSDILSLALLQSDLVHFRVP